MANRGKRLSTNVEGNFFVDHTCINCDTCRQLAPLSFREIGEYSSVSYQPVTELETLEAYRSLLACPVGSIGTIHPDKNILCRAQDSFPLLLEGEVYYTGFNSEKSFGANAYFIRHPEGNWLIDSPRYVSRLLEAFDQLGGIKYIFLSHEDDVAEAARYATRFQGTRITHADDAEAVPGAEWIVNERHPFQMSPDFLIIPVPGHTPGSMALLYKQRFLFTGDHLWWDRDTKSLEVPSVYVWNEEQLHQSTRLLLDYPFEWVLPGHGSRVHLPSSNMRLELNRLVQSFQGVKAPSI
ncbi:MAG: MBL fold metallo-hydrolase [Nitrospirota bacterium]|nr:MAG: MBL fold metallo-hydrolase [Nitrospirota bacterium]